MNIFEKLIYMLLQTVIRTLEIKWRHTKTCFVADLDVLSYLFAVMNKLYFV